jgi:hypothetical protein
LSTLTTFDTTKEFLSDMLKQLGDGKTRLPDFQRGWADDQIRYVLASFPRSLFFGQPGTATRESRAIWSIPRETKKFCRQLVTRHTQMFTSCAHYPTHGIQPLTTVWRKFPPGALWLSLIFWSVTPYA